MASTRRDAIDAAVSRRCRSTQVLNKSITLTTFNYLRRGLFEKDKLTVATLVTTRILVDNDLLPGEDVSYLFLGKVHPDPGISRRPAVLRRLHAIDATRVHLTMTWVVYFSNSSHFGPFLVNTMLRAGDAVAERGDGEGEGGAGEGVSGVNGGV